MLLAASGVQPLHQQGPRPLPTGILDDEPFQFGDGGRDRRPSRAGPPPDPPSRPAAARRGGHPRRRRTRRRGTRHRPGRATVRGPPTTPRRHRDPALVERPATLRCHLHEPLGVDRGRVDVQPVSGRHGLQDLAADIRQRAPQPHHVGLDRLARARRWIIAPERVDDHIDGHGPTRPAGEQRQQPPAVGASHVQLLARVLHGQRAEHAHPQRPAQRSSSSTRSTDGRTSYITLSLTSPSSCRNVRDPAVEVRWKRHSTRLPAGSHRARPCWWTNHRPGGTSNAPISSSKQLAADHQRELRQQAEDHRRARQAQATGTRAGDASDGAVGSPRPAAHPAAAGSSNRVLTCSPPRPPP